MHTEDKTAGVAGRQPVAPVFLLFTDDLPVGRRLRRLAAEHQLIVADTEPPRVAGEPEPAVVVLDLHLPDSIGKIRAWRSRWPTTLLVGYLGMPDRQQWLAAQRAGCDLVSNRGAVVLRLRELLARSTPADRAFPLFDAADAAGRLGLVFRAADTPVGPVAVYRVSGGFHAIADRCPHAGAVLSDGEVEEGVLTCPGHGSRFDICTGERVRGPSDAEVAVFRLADVGGQVCLIVSNSP